MTIRHLPLLEYPRSDRCVGAPVIAQSGNSHEKQWCDRRAVVVYRAHRGPAEERD